MTESKNRERGGTSALCGRCWYITYNNQMNDGVGVEGCVGEEMRTGETLGRWRSLAGAAVELNDKKIERGGMHRPWMAAS